MWKNIQWMFNEGDDQGHEVQDDSSQYLPHSLLEVSMVQLVQFKT